MDNVTQIEHFLRLLALPERAHQCSGPTMYVPPGDFFQVETHLFPAHRASGGGKSRGKMLNIFGIAGQRLPSTEYAACDDRRKNVGGQGSLEWSFPYDCADESSRSGRN